MFLFFGVAGSQTIKIVMKWMTDRSRPENPFDLYVHESSFPSGHATTAIFIAIAIAYLFTKKLSKYKKLMLNAGLLAIALLVSFSRIFTQVHYFSDVGTGIILAVGSFSFTVLFFTFLHLKYKNTSFYSKIFN
jgi:undecaprenyl-diphosphatase